MPRKALITGITGQDGSYLAEFLLKKKYEVHGIVRRVAVEDKKNHFTRIQHLINRDAIKLHSATLENYPSICHILQKVKPDEIYHLAAQSFVSYSFEDEHSTMGMNIAGTHFMLSAASQIVPKTKFYFAGSSEMFGKVAEVPQTEKTSFHPRSPYGISKVTGYNLTRYYRESPDIRMFAAAGILFNHESERRGFEFVTRKISHTTALIKHGLAKKIVLGNPEAKRDWGYAKEYVGAMWRILQRPKPDDYVIATGETHSVEEFAETAMKLAGLSPKRYIIWNNPADVRPLEVDILVGDASKARKELGWKPRIKFRDLVELMVRADMRLVKKHIKGYI
ncbi:MAG: GDP-mannose 4,6-dehydratase [Candidatus Yanofskybacteria bacterium]|nr:GDP-mannose 4,6-dehydratase [Candidatus Yanofskybacteria bacterium]